MPRTKSRDSEARATTSRAAQQRPDPGVNHTSQFYIPPKAIPKGFTYRWVAVEHDSGGTRNEQNWQVKYSAGWRPVPRSRHMDIFPPIPDVGFGGDTTDIIKRGGQILCEKATVDVERDRELNAARAKQQMDAIDWTQDKNSNPFAQTMPRVDRGSQTTFSHAAEFKE